MDLIKNILIFLPFPTINRGYRYRPEYHDSGGYICPADVFYGRPKRGVNTYGEWKVIVNLPGSQDTTGYTQTQRLEQCLYPQAPCSFIDHAYHSSCLQKHSFVRLLAYSYQQGLHIDSFKLPSACSCHVESPKYGIGDTRQSEGYQRSRVPRNDRVSFSRKPSITLFTLSSTPKPSPSPSPYAVHVG